MFREEDNVNSSIPSNTASGLAISHSTLAVCSMNGKSKYIEGTAKATSTGKNCMLSMYLEKDIF
jgi:hypothetical protein